MDDERRGQDPGGAIDLVTIDRDGADDALVRGRATFDGAVKFAQAVRASRETTRVRFDTDADDGCTVLTVEAVDRPGLLLLITRTLFRERVQIVGSHVTTREGRAADRFR